MKDLAAFILAGGKGKRMGILCKNRPKPVLPFGGKYRVIDFALSNCINSKISNIAVLTDYQRSNIANYLQKWQVNSKKPSNIEVLEPKSHYLGTADAVYQNLKYLKDQKIENILVLAADHVYSMDYRDIMAFHELNKANVTIGLSQVSREQASHLGTVTIDSDNRVTNFAEKVNTDRDSLASMGIYVFNVGTLIEYLCMDSESNDSMHDFGYSIIPEMVNRSRVFGYKFDGYWRDIGTIEAYHAAHMELLNEQPGFVNESNWPVHTVRNSLVNSNISIKGRIINSIISPGCTIKGHVENSVISPGVWIDEYAEVKNSIIMNNVFIGEHSLLDSSIIGKGVSIGKCCQIGSPDQKDGITVIESDTIAPYTSINGDVGGNLDMALNELIRSSTLSSSHEELLK